MVAAASEALKVATAARLSDGRPVYLGHAGWVSDIAEAEALSDDAATELLSRAQAAARANIVIGPELIDVVRADGQIAPVTLRERIRATGPTVAAGSVFVR